MQTMTQFAGKNWIWMVAVGTTLTYAPLAGRTG